MVSCVMSSRVKSRTAPIRLFGFSDTVFLILGVSPFTYSRRLGRVLFRGSRCQDKDATETGETLRCMPPVISPRPLSRRARPGLRDERVRTTQAEFAARRTLWKCGRKMFRKLFAGRLLQLPPGSTRASEPKSTSPREVDGRDPRQVLPTPKEARVFALAQRGAFVAHQLTKIAGFSRRFLSTTSRKAVELPPPRGGLSLSEMPTLPGLSGSQNVRGDGVRDSRPAPRPPLAVPHREEPAT